MKPTTIFPAIFASSNSFADFNFHKKLTKCIFLLGAYLHKMRRHKMGKLVTGTHTMLL